MSSEVVSPLLEWLNAHPHLAGLATFVISAAESVAIIGTIVPGSIMMTAIGALAGAGVIPLWSTLIWAILGAIVGDGISYWMGHYFRDRLKLIWPFRTNPNLLLTGERFVLKYGGMSVFIGRFVGPVRALVPMVAGMLGMRPLAFTVANVASAIGWAPAYMLPGILLGAAAQELPPDIAFHVLFVLIFIVLFVLLCLWLLYKILQLVQFQTNQLQNWIWRRLEKSPFFYPTTVLLRHHNPEKTHGQFSLALLFLITATFLCILLITVKMYGPANIGINDVMFHLFRGLNTRYLSVDNFMLTITLLGQKQVLLPAVFVIFAWLLYTRRTRAAAHVAALTMLTGGGVFVLKHLLKIPRPWGVVNPIPTFSMPSGHATLSSAFFFGLAFLMAAALQPQRRWPFYLIAVLISFVVGLSRLYLGVHWFTDIMAGWLLSASCLILVTISYKRKKEKPVNIIALLSLSLITLCLSFTFFYYRHFATFQKDFAQKEWPHYEIDLNRWWAKNNLLPAYRISLFGFPSQKINIEWVGNIDNIRSTLMEEGWRKPPARDLVSTLHRIADVSSTQYLPLISPQYLDKRPALILVRSIDNEKNFLVIRLWNSYRTIKQNGNTLWIGTLSRVPRSYSWIYKSTSSEINISSAILFPLKKAHQEWEWKMLALFVGEDKLLQLKILLLKPR